MKVIGYIRTSTEWQSDWFWLQVQNDAIVNYSKSECIELVKIYKEEWVSGSLEYRPALNEMFQYIKSNKIDFVVFLRLDRLARDLLVQENLLAEFQRLSVKPISIDEPDLLSSDPSRVMFRQMKGAIAQYEKSMIALRLSSWRKKKVELGKGYAWGNLPFGFRFENEKYIPIEEEMRVLKEIFRLRRKPRNGKRMSFRKISEYLNKKFGHLRSFSEGGVFYMANNPFYRWLQEYWWIEFKHKGIAELFS